MILLYSVSANLVILTFLQETQIQVVMYGTDIKAFEESLVPFQTYLVSTAFVRESIREYGEPLHPGRLIVTQLLNR